MKLDELKQRVDHAWAQQGGKDLIVAIPDKNQHGMGLISFSEVTGAKQGIDIDHKMFFISAE